MAPLKEELWTVDEEETLKRLWATTDVIKIAEIIGRTEAAVRARANRIGLPPRQVRFEWTEERISELKRLRDLGWGCTAIHQHWAGVPGVHAILHKVRELGLPVGNYWYAETFNKERIYRRLREREQPRLEIVEASHAIPEGRKLISLFDLNDETCRYSFGEPGKPGFGFCGKPVMRGKAWCPECWTKAVAGVVDIRIPEKKEPVKPFEKRAKKFLAWRRNQHVVAA
jgi:hypothetical protein